MIENKKFPNFWEAQDQLRAFLIDLTGQDDLVLWVKPEHVRVFAGGKYVWKDAIIPTTQQLEVEYEKLRAQNIPVRMYVFARGLDFLVACLVAKYDGENNFSNGLNLTLAEEMDGLRVVQNQLIWRLLSLVGKPYHFSLDKTYSLGGLPQ